MSADPQRTIFFNSHLQLFNEPQDLALTMNLIRRTMDACYRSFYSEPVLRYFKEYHSENNIKERAQKGYMLVYRLNDWIIGTGALISDYVSSVYVDPDYQRKGIGKQIMQALFNYARQKEVRKLVLDATPGSTEFYLSLGFVLLKEEIMMVDNDFPLLYYVMEKQL